jgi:hypothetical protein
MIDIQIMTMIIIMSEMAAPRCGLYALPKTAFLSGAQQHMVPPKETGYDEGAGRRNENHGYAGQNTDRLSGTQLEETRAEFAPRSWAASITLWSILTITENIGNHEGQIVIHHTQHRRSLRVYDVHRGQSEKDRAG